MKINVRACLLGVSSPLLMTSCSEVVSEGGAVHVRWALGTSLGLLATLPVCLFLAWCFYKVYIYRSISPENSDMMRLYRVVKTCGLCLALPVLPVVGMLEGCLTDYSISEQQVIIRGGGPAEFSWKDLQQVMEHSSGADHTLSFEKDQTKRSLYISGSLLGREAAEKVREWVNAAAKAKGINYTRI